jgi:large subunit ribosomal protein L10
MTREEKNQIVAQLSEQLQENDMFYLADTSELDAGSTSKLRRECFKKSIKMTVVKNTLLKRALDTVEGKDFSSFYETLSGPTSIMFTEVGNAPAKLIKEFRKKYEKPILKGAFIEESIYIGDDQLTMLSELKSKDELLGEIVSLLQSPAKNVVSALKSSSSTVAGLVKTLQERGE